MCLVQQTTAVDSSFWFEATKHIHIHTRTHIYISVYVCVCACLYAYINYKVLGNMEEMEKKTPETP